MNIPVDVLRGGKMGRHGLTWMHLGNNTLDFNDSHHRSPILNNKSVYYFTKKRERKLIDLLIRKLTIFKFLLRNDVTSKNFSKDSILFFYLTFIFISFAFSRANGVFP